MPLAINCAFSDTEISVADALLLREDARLGRRASPDFRCIQCGEAVRPHRKGSFGAAHFEHLRRNPLCKLSDPARA
ncbi:MAG: hypothetical protein DCF26_08360 [Burkholderiales bacterium]|nr:MAG: hypothetical protein DCF26_08360 [Burkholderiales bacterium]